MDMYHLDLGLDQDRSSCLDKVLRSLNPATLEIILDNVPSMGDLLEARAFGVVPRVVHVFRHLAVVEDLAFSRNLTSEWRAPFR